MAMNFFAAGYLRFSPLTNRAIVKVIRYAASFTFALYLSHRPLLDFFSFVIGHDPHSALSVAWLVVMTLSGAWLFGLVTEHRKEAWRAMFARLIQWTRRRIVSVAPQVYLSIAPNRSMPSIRVAG